VVEDHHGLSDQCAFLSKESFTKYNGFLKFKNFRDDKKFEFWKTVENLKLSECKKWQLALPMKLDIRQIYAKMEWKSHKKLTMIINDSKNT
jgi:hypothetical protein